jgi:type I restriction enzyme, S subunit
VTNTTGWTPTRLKHIAQCNLRSLSESTDPDWTFVYVDIGNVSPSEMNVDQEPIRFEDAPSRARRLAEPGDVVVSTVRTYLRAVATVPESEDDLVFSTGFAVLHPSPEVDSGWFAYYLQSDEFVDRVVAYSDGVNYPAINASRLIALPVLAPPRDIQREIAAYLDDEASRIAALITRQEALVSLLSERRTAMIARAVWRGLEPEPHLASTGLDTVPGAPEHWLRRRNKNMLFERADLSTTGEEELLTVSHITGITPRSHKTVTMFEAESTVGYRLVSPGDLVINTMWAWMGALAVSTWEGIVSPAYGVYSPHPGLEADPRYFNYLYRSTPYVTEMTRVSTGIRSNRLRLYPEVFLRMPVVIPRVEEQRQIADWLDEGVARIDALVDKAQEHIALAKERRSALISDAVTGKIDVRTARKVA